MPATFKAKYAAAAAITLTLNGLANDGARQSAVVDNAVNLYLDSLVSLALRTAAGALDADPVVEIWAYAVGQGGIYTDGATGADAAFVLPANPNLRLLGVVQIHTADVLAYSAPMSVAQAFGGVLPSAWGLVVANKTGLALNAAGNAASYVGVQAQTT